MGMIEVKKDFTQRELMWFGPLFALFVGIIGWIIYSRFDSPSVAKGIWVAAAVIIVLYYLIPPIRRPVYRGWIYSVVPIGWVISHVLLAAIYYLLFTPVAFIMRLCGYDPMSRKFDDSQSTYWVQREPVEDINRYFKQY